MVQEQRQRRRRGASGITVYPDSHLGSVLYGKRPRMLEDDGVASLGEAKEKGKNALMMGARILLFPFFAIFKLSAAVFKRLRLSSRDKKPIAVKLVPYYKPQINMDGSLPAFKAADISGDIAWKEPAAKRSPGFFRPRRSQRSLEDQIFNKRKMSGSTRAKIAAAALAFILVLAGAGYGGWWYIEGRYSMVTINDNGVLTEVRTADETVADVLAASAVALGTDDMLSMHPSTEVRDGLNIAIVRAKGVTIATKDGEVFVDMAQGTVHDALAKAEIAYDEDDDINPSLDTEISDGLYIRKVDVEVQYQTKKEEIPFKTVEQDSNSLDKGKTEVKVEGSNGEKSIKERVIVRDGAEASREIIATSVDVAPVDKVVLNGTYVEPPKPTPQPQTNSAVASSNNSSGGKTGSGNKTSSSGSSKPSGGGSSSSSSSSSSASKPPIAAPAGGPSEDQIASTMTADFITAYTHTGNKTSQGTWPARGTCAVNPKVIPYGTRLYIPGYGYATALDTGGAFRSGSGIDVFMETKGECQQWGRKYSVTVYILK